MRTWFGICAALLLPLYVGAFAPEVVDLGQPYQVIPVDVSDEQPADYLGSLQGYPEMYEMTVEATTTLRVELAQRFGAAPVPFALIAVEALGRDQGVKEVARLRPVAEDWTPFKSSALGFTLLEAPVLEATVGAGTYRVEVSTPDNAGRYLLTINTDSTEDTSGYFTTLGGIYTTQQHFGYSFFRMLMSSYVYYPLGILLLAFVLQRTWKYRKIISNAS